MTIELVQTYDNRTIQKYGDLNTFNYNKSLICIMTSLLRIRFQILDFFKKICILICNWVKNNCKIQKFYIICIWVKCEYKYEFFELTMSASGTQSLKTDGKLNLKEAFEVDQLAHTRQECTMSTHLYIDTHFKGYIFDFMSNIVLKIQ